MIKHSDLHEWLSQVTRNHPDRYLCHVNEFLPFGRGLGAPVMPQSEFAPIAPTGYPVGIALDTVFNKATGQGNFFAAVLGELVGTINPGTDVLDDGVLATKIVDLWRTWLTASYFVDTGSASTIVIANPPGLTFPVPFRGLRVTVKTNASCTGASTVNWMGHGAVALHYTDGSDTSNGDYTTGMLLDMDFDGTSWILLSVPLGLFHTSTRKLNASGNFFVDASAGTDSPTNGLTTGAGAWRTLTYARNQVRDTYDMRGVPANFTASGAFTAGLAASGPLFGQGSGAAGEVWNFASGSTVTALSGVSLNGGAKLTVSTSGVAVVFTCIGGGAVGIGVLDAGSIVNIVGPVNFGTCTLAHLYAALGGTIYVGSNFTVSGNATAMAFGHGQATINIGVFTITFAGTPVITTLYLADLISFIGAPGGGGGIVYSGAVTTTKFSVSTNSVLFTGDAGASIPGAAGGIATGGQVP